MKESHSYYKKLEKLRNLTMSDDTNNQDPNKQPQNVISLQSAKNEKKRKQEPTRAGSKKKTPSQKVDDEVMWKLLEIIEEQQARIQRLEENFIRLVRVLKKLGESEKQPPPPSSV